MEHELVRIFTAQDNMQAEMVLDTMKENGIPALKKDVGSAGLMNLYGGNSSFGEDIFVAEENAERAGQVLADMGLGDFEETAQTAEKYLVVVDMQNDFITGSLGTGEAEAILPRVIRKAAEFDGVVCFTRDTHETDYLNTQEGKLLPVEHCIRGTEGWELADGLRELVEEQGLSVYEKNTFGCTALAEALRESAQAGGIASIELVGLCTDICVVSNALLFKAYMPEIPISADASCCAGVTPERHLAALETMKSCQIFVETPSEYQ